MQLNNDLNGSMQKINPSNSECVYSKFITESGEGWYRFAKFIYTDSVAAAQGAANDCFEIFINQIFNHQLGCFWKIDLYMIYSDSAKLLPTGYGELNITKIRIVRNGTTIFLDFYCHACANDTRILIKSIFKPIAAIICLTPYITPEISENEIVVSQVDLKDLS